MNVVIRQPQAHSIDLDWFPECIGRYNHKVKICHGCLRRDDRILALHQRIMYDIKKPCYLLEFARHGYITKDPEESENTYYRRIAHILHNCGLRQWYIDRAELSPMMGLMIQQIQN